MPVIDLDFFCTILTMIIILQFEHTAHARPLTIPCSSSSTLSRTHSFPFASARSFFICCDLFLYSFEHTQKKREEWQKFTIDYKIPTKYEEKRAVCCCFFLPKPIKCVINVACLQSLNAKDLRKELMSVQFRCRPIILFVLCQALCYWINSTEKDENLKANNHTLNPHLFKQKELTTTKNGHAINKTYRIGNKQQYYNNNKIKIKNYQQ